MKRNSGFTLLEVLLAIAIFSIGVVSAMSLAFSDLNNSKINFGRIRAAHLAREGVELVRNIRDSNWLKYQANYDCDSGTLGLQYCSFDDGLQVPLSVIDYTTSTLQSVCTASSLDECLSDSEIIGPSDNICVNSRDCNLYYIDEFYVHDQSTTTLISEAQRVIQLRSICSDGSGAEYFDVASSDCAPDEKIGVEVTSRVRWSAGGQVNTINIVSSLYDWRY